MSDKEINKRDALENEIIEEGDTNCFSEISVLIDKFNKKKISIDDLVSAVERIPEGKIEMLVNDEENKYDRHKKYLLDYVLYATFFDKFSWLRSKNTQKVVNEEIGKEIQQINIYSNEVSEDLRELIKKVELSSKNNKYIDYNLLIQLFIYKYSKTLESNENELFNSTKTQEEYKNDSEVHKKQANKLFAKIAFYTMLAIPTYLGPLAAGIGLGYTFGKAMSTHPYVSVNDTEPLNIAGLQDSTHLDFKAAFPDDYMTRTLQFITEFSETKNKKVVVKVYDYTDVDISQRELDSIELDEGRLIYLNTFSDKQLSGDYISEKTVLGKYSGKAHRDLSTLKYKVSTGELIFYSLSSCALSAMIIYAILFGIIKKTSNKQDKKALLNAIKTSMQERRFELDKSELDMKEFHKLEREIDILADRQFARRRANELDTFNEKYYSNAEEEFQKKLRRQ